MDDYKTKKLFSGRKEEGKETNKDIYQDSRKEESH